MKHLRFLLAILAAIWLVLSVIPTRAAETPSLTDQIHGALLKLQPWSGDVREEPSAREARLREVATAVSSAVQHAQCVGAWKGSDSCKVIWGGNPRELAAAVLALGEHETHYAKLVQSGRCSEMPVGQQCDNGNARGPWQQWPKACPEMWRELAGSAAALRAGAWCAARLLVGAANVCAERDAGPNWAGAFSRYGGQQRCRPGNAARVATMRRWQAALAP